MTDKLDKICRLITLGAKHIGTIETDMSFLREREDFELVRPAQGHTYYSVEFDLVPIVEGRQLRYEARWPAGKGKGIKLNEGQVCIASAFRPGTA